MCIIFYLFIYFCRGILKIAEVASRLDNVRSFISALSSLGFKMVSKVSQQTARHQGDGNIRLLLWDVNHSCRIMHHRFRMNH